MKHVLVSSKMTFRHIGAFFALSTLPALAQSGRPINSVQTLPGTSAGSNYHDTLESNKPGPVDHNLGSEVTLQSGIGTSKAVADLPPDAGSSTADRKAARRSDGKLSRDRKFNRINRGSELPNANEGISRLPLGTPIQK